MKYTIYKITNKLNGKIYIGKHQTKDINDSYMGSGKLLQRAQEKYGIDSFVKEIIHIFDTEEEMNTKEQELVTEEFCSRDDTYNICVGGKGGFSYINKHALYDTDVRQANGKKAMAKLREERPDIFSAAASRERTKQRWQDGVYDASKSTFARTPLVGSLNPKARKIQDELGIVYPTVKSLAEAKGIHKDSVARRVRNGVYKYID